MENNEMDITGLDEAEVIAALHNGTRPLGTGAFRARGDITADEVRAEMRDDHERDFPGIINNVRNGMRHFDYFHGRPLKVSIGNGKLAGAWLYDRDAGQGACARAVESVRNKVK